MPQDIVFAIRQFRRHPGLFGITVAGLAIAIGIATAVLSVAKPVAFAGYGASASESLYRVALTSGTFGRITGNSPFRGQWTFGDFSDLRDLATTMTVVGWASDGAEFRWSSDDGGPLEVRYLAVSGNYFSVLGVRASAGR